MLTKMLRPISEATTTPSCVLVEIGPLRSNVLLGPRAAALGETHHHISDCRHEGHGPSVTLS